MISNMILGIVIFTILAVVIIALLVKYKWEIGGWFADHFSILGVLIAIIVILAFITVFILLCINNII